VKRDPSLRKLFALFLSVVFTLSNVVLSHALETNIWTERAENKQVARLPFPAGNSSAFLDRFPSISAVPLSSHWMPIPGRRVSRVMPTVPAQFGRFQKWLKPSSGALSAPLIVHIQDVHKNIEAQKNIGGALAALMTDRRVSLLALEGAFGTIDLKRLAAFPRQDVVRAVADSFLSENKMSGAARAAYLTARAGQDVVGVDDPLHYEANVRAYKESAPLGPAVSKEIERRQTDLERRKAAVFNPPLKMFDARVQAYRRGETSLGVYVRDVLCDADLTGVRQAPLFLQALAAERELDMAVVERERSSMLRDLAEKISESERSSLIEEALAARSGATRQVDFYTALERRCRRAGIDGARFPAMKRYAAYLDLAERIDGESLFQELTQLESAAYRRLARTDSERALIAQSHLSNLTEKLVAFSLTRDEWDDYSSPRQASSPGLAGTAAFENFYREAQARDKAMAENFLAAAKVGRRDILVLVTGGFHSTGIDRALVKAGYQVAVFVPKLTKVEADAGSAYLNVFTQEKTPLEKLVRGEKLFMSPNPFPNDAEFTASVAASFPGKEARVMSISFPKLLMSAKAQATSPFGRRRRDKGTLALFKDPTLGSNDGATSFSRRSKSSCVKFTNPACISSNVNARSSRPIS